jgi:hypothetical protein
MSYTFANQQSKLSVLLQDSNTTADDAWPIAVRKSELNRGELQFCKDSKLVRNKATGTLDATNKLALPEDFLELVSLIVSNYVLNRDREISIADYDRWYSYAGTYPIYYLSQESGTRYINFIGSVTGVGYTLHYIAKPSTDLSLDADESLIPDEFREASVYYAAAQLLQQVGKSEYADRYLAIYTRLVRDGQAQAENMYLTKQYANPDLNVIDAGSNDTQGYGYDFGG